ncbi:MAG: ribosome maturation factor RimM [Streptosporangiales bacterium]|nr:ribosome maturation factor RimM [Streptosporangiales bacterium]
MQLVVGLIGRAHGVRGDVTVDVRTDSPEERFAPGTTLEVQQPERGPLTVETVRWHSGRLLVRFAGVRDRTGAEELRGLALVIDSDTLPPPEDPEEFHDHQLIGLTARTPGGETLGEVVDIQHLGQDLLVIDGPDGEVLVPFVRALVPEVNLDDGHLVVDPPPGLLDLNG